MGCLWGGRQAGSGLQARGRALQGASVAAPPLRRRCADPAPPEGPAVLSGHPDPTLVPNASPTPASCLSGGRGVQRKPGMRQGRGCMGVAVRAKQPMPTLPVLAKCISLGPPGLPAPGPLGVPRWLCSAALHWLGACSPARMRGGGVLAHAVGGACMHTGMPAGLKASGQQKSRAAAAGPPWAHAPPPCACAECGDARRKRGGAAFGRLQRASTLINGSHHLLQVSGGLARLSAD